MNNKKIQGALSSIAGSGSVINPDKLRRSLKSESEKLESKIEQLSVSPEQTFKILALDLFEDGEVEQGKEFAKSALSLDDNVFNDIEHINIKCIDVEVVYELSQILPRAVFVSCDNPEKVHKLEWADYYKRHALTLEKQDKALCAIRQLEAALKYGAQISDDEIDSLRPCFLKPHFFCIDDSDESQIIQFEAEKCSIDIAFKKKEGWICGVQIVKDSFEIPKGLKKDKSVRVNNLGTTRNELLCVAIFLGCNNLLKWIIELEIKKNSLSKESVYELISLSLYFKKLEITKVILDVNRINLNSVNHPALMYEFLEMAFSNNDTKLLEFLVNENLDLNGVLYEEYNILHCACAFGYLDHVKFLLIHYVDINQPSRKGITALMMAVKNDQSNIARYLMRIKKCDIHRKNANGKNALMYAAEYANTEIVRHLLIRGLNIDEIDRSGRTALCFALKPRADDNDLWGYIAKYGNDEGEKNSRIDVVNLLLTKNANPNIADKKGVTPLMLAARSGNNECFQALLKLHADLDAVDSKGRTVLMYAAMQKSTDIVVYLISIGVNIHKRCKRGKTALMIAARNSLEIVKLLLLEGADVNVIDTKGRTVLTVAVEYGTKVNSHSFLNRYLIEHDSKMMGGIVSLQAYPNFKMVEVILAENSHLNERDHLGRTALIIATEAECYHAMNRLLEKGADPNVQDNQGRTALMISVKNRHSGQIMLLIDHGADFHLSDHEGKTALMLSRGKDKQNIRLLFENNAFSDNEGQYGISAIISATRECDLSMIDCLIEQGDDVDTINASGMTALMIAVNLGYDQIINCLIQNNANLNKKSIYGFTALMMASEISSLEILRSLITGRATVDEECYNGMTALFFAVMKIGNLKHVRLLLEAGANVNHQSKEGTTPLMAALRYGHDDAVDCLLEHGAKIDYVEKDGCTTLMILAERPNDKVLKLLFESSVNINQRDNQGRTALSIARQHNNTLMLIILLGRGAVENTIENNVLEALRRFSFRALSESSGNSSSEDMIYIDNTIRHLRK